MKKLIITNLFTPYNRGGAEQVVEIQAKQEQQMGNEVLIFTAVPFSLSALVGQESVLGERIRKIGVYPLNLYFYANDGKFPAFIRFFWHIIDMFNIHSAFVLWRVLTQEKPDEIISHNLKGLGYLLPLVIRLSHIPWSHVIHDVQLITPSGLITVGNENHWQHTGLLTKAYYNLTAWLFGSPDTVMFPSNWCKTLHENYYFFRSSKKIVQVNEPDPIYASHPHEEKIPNRYTYAGQLEPHKGIHDIFEQAKKYPENEYHLYGAGSMLQEAQKIAHQQKNLIIHGPVDKKTLALALAQSTYFIYPSRVYENCPMAIREAQSAGCIIIAPKIGGIEELLQEKDIEWKRTLA